MMRNVGRVSKLLAVLSTVGATIDIQRETRASDGAYAVDTAEVSDPGACKLGTWAAFASNRDFFAAVNPSCVFDLSRPVELSVQLSRSRTDREWTTSAAPKFKTNLVPGGIGRWSIGVAGGASFDLTAGETAGAFAFVPATLRVTENARINLNGGWQWDRIAGRHYLLYGAGLDARTSDNIWTFTGEVFGLAGSADEPGTTRARFQTGVRFRPPPGRFSIDVVYGRNLTGENANWITVATILRFPPPKK